MKLDYKRVIPKYRLIDDTDSDHYELCSALSGLLWKWNLVFCGYAAFLHVSVVLFFVLGYQYWESDAVLGPLFMAFTLITVLAMARTRYAKKSILNRALPAVQAYLVDYRGIQPPPHIFEIHAVV
jgi:hypothetical protein